MARRYIEDVAQRLYEQAAFYEGLTQQSPDYEHYANVIARYEGFIPRAKIVEQEKIKADGKAKNEPDSIHKTVGYGHLMDPEVSQYAFRVHLPGVSWDDVKSGDRELTEEEGIKLLMYDSKRKVDQAFELWPTFKDHRLPQGIKDLGIALWYQGSFTKSPSKGSPTAMKYIDEALAGQGTFGRAAIELLNRNGYRERGKRDKNGYNGVATRHEEMALALWSLDPPQFRDYDLPTAIAVDSGPRVSEGAQRGAHWPSRVASRDAKGKPTELHGLMLKSIDHPSFATTLDVEVSQQQNSVYWNPTTSRLHTMKSGEAPAELTQLTWDPEEDILSDPRLTDASLVGQDLRPKVEKPRY